MKKNYKLMGIVAIVAAVVLLFVILSVTGVIKGPTGSGGLAGDRGTPAYAAERAGHYAFTSMKSGEEVTEAAIFEASDLETSLDMNEDLTGKLLLFGQEIEFTWDEENLISNGDATRYTYSDGTITLDSDGTTLVFEKETAEAETQE